MADQIPSPDTADVPGTPRWVKVFAIIALIVVLLVVVMMLAGGNHGPGRHLPSSGADHQMPTTSLAAIQAPPESGRW
jgi:hypothetical protein